MERISKKAINSCKEELQLGKGQATVEADDVSFEDKVSFTEKVRRLTN